MTKLLERVVFWMLLVCSIQSASYNLIKRQCHKNFLQTGTRPNQQNSPYSKIIFGQTFFKWHFKISMSMYIFNFIKYFILGSLDLNLFSHYHLVDCFVLGRFYFVGRANKASKYIAEQFMLTFIISRIFLTLIMHKYKFGSHEFLLHNYSEVVMNEIMAEKRTDSRRSYLPFHNQNQYHNDINEMTDTTDTIKNNNNPNPIFLVRNPFPSAGCKEFLLRLNRTPQCWELMAKFSLCFMIWCISAVIIWYFVITFFLSGAITSDLGFQLNYYNCVNGIKQLDQITAGNYSYIHVPIPNSPDIDLEQVPFKIPFRYRDDLNSYHKFRIVADILENHFFYLDFMLTVLALSYIVMLVAVDQLINAHKLEKILRTLVEDLEQRHQKRTVDLTESGYSHHKRTLECEQVNTIHVQAYLVDHFVAVKGYRGYISFTLALCMLIWITCTFTFCIWMGALNSETLAKEFAMTEMFTFTTLNVFLGVIAMVRTSNRRLYPLIASAMAFDNYWLTKARWTVIMKYYSPNPLYCFDVLNTIEVSWLFCLKVSYTSITY